MSPRHVNFFRVFTTKILRGRFGDRNEMEKNFIRGIESMTKKFKIKICGESYRGFKSENQIYR